MRCRMCNRLLQGDELYRKGIDEDCCYVCVPLEDEDVDPQCAAMIDNLNLLDDVEGISIMEDDDNVD